MQYRNVQYMLKRNPRLTRVVLLCSEQSKNLTPSWQAIDEIIHHSECLISSCFRAAEQGIVFASTSDDVADLVKM